VAVGHEIGEPGTGPDHSGRPIRAAFLLVRALDYEEFMECENADKEGKAAKKGREKAGKANYEWLAYIEGCSRARISQIMALLRLPRDLQEEILFMEADEKARDLVKEGDLRYVVKIQDREEQQRRWNALLERRRTFLTANTPVPILQNISTNPTHCFLYGPELM
jgi:hypothetical protein